MTYVLCRSVHRRRANFLVARTQYVVIIRFLSLRRVLIADASYQRFSYRLDESAAGAGGGAIFVTILVLEVVFMTDKLLRFVT